jgi:hypothetical protein
MSRPAPSPVERCVVCHAVEHVGYIDHEWVPFTPQPEAASETLTSARCCCGKYTLPKDERTVRFNDTVHQRIGAFCGPWWRVDLEDQRAEIAALRAALAEAQNQIDLYEMTPGAVHDLAVEHEATCAALKKAEEENERLRVGYEERGKWHDAAWGERHGGHAFVPKPEAASEVKHYGERVYECKPGAPCDLCCARAERDAAEARVATLLEIIKYAPHGSECKTVLCPHLERVAHPCDCWKAAAALEKP